MRKTVLTIFLIIQIIGVSQNVPYWEWAKNIVQVYPNGVPLKVSADQFGNVFVLGNSEGSNANPSLILDSGAFIAKYNRHGAFLWSRIVGGLPSDICASQSGDVYVVGTKNWYRSTSTVGAFIKKINYKGDVVWERNYQTKNSSINSVTVAPSGNIYVTGTSGDTLLMDNQVKINRHYFFTAKLNSNGLTQWLRTAATIPDTISTRTIGGGYYVALDLLENVYIAYNSSACPNWSCDEHWLLKLDKNGTYLFHKLYGQYYAICKGIFVESNGDIIMSHYDDCWTSGGAVVLKRYNSNLTSFSWSLTIGGWECRQTMMDVSPVPDDSGGLYIAGGVGEQCWWGRFDTLQFGPKNIITDSVQDIIVCRINRSDGKYTDAWHVAGRLFDGVQSITTDKLGNCYAAGYFNEYYKDPSHMNDTLCFDNNCLIGQTGNTQVFLAKLKVSNQEINDDVGIPEYTRSTINVYPNPSEGVFNISGEIRSWKVYDLTGVLISEGESSSANLSDYYKGVYFLVVDDNGILRSTKLLKSR